MEASIISNSHLHILSLGLFWVSFKKSLLSTWQKKCTCRKKSFREASINKGIITHYPTPLCFESIHRMQSTFDEHSWCEDFRWTQFKQFKHTTFQTQHVPILGIISLLVSYPHLIKPSWNNNKKNETHRWMKSWCNLSESPLERLQNQPNIIPYSRPGSSYYLWNQKTPK